MISDDRMGVLVRKMSHFNSLAHARPSADPKYATFGVLQPLLESLVNEFSRSR